MPSSVLIQNSGNLLSTNDVVAIAISGADYATARFSIPATGTATATAQISVDGGVNYVPAPYAKKVSAAAANPTVQAITATTLVAGDVWEVPLPADATHFRLLCAAGGTATSVSLTGGAQFIPGVPVVAVLYDVTSAVNTALDTGVLTTSGWAGLSATFVTPAGGSAAIKTVDDAGANPAQVTVPASASVSAVLSPLGAAQTALPATGFASAAWRSKRSQATSAGVAAVTSRIRIEAWR